MNPKQDHHVKELQMKEEKGKILLQPSFTQQQQQNNTLKQQTQQQHDK